MRSRFAAYSLGEVGYIMETTHPDGPHFQADRVRWEEDLRPFLAGTHFRGLKILARSVDGDEGFVTFRATLTQAGQDASFTERSRFLRARGRWLYHSGVQPTRNEPASSAAGAELPPAKTS